MSDLLLQPVGDGYEWDYVYQDGDLLGDDTIQSAIIYSLLTDAEDPTLSTGERRGSWMDFLLEDPTDREGCLWWLLRREKQTDQTLSRAIDYAQQALAWAIEDGIASKFDITGSWVGIGEALFNIKAYPPDGATAEQLALFQGQSEAVNVSIPVRLLAVDSVVIPLGS